MSDPTDSPEVRWMRRALELARRGRGAVEPNPLVGAVLVRGRTVVGEGWHRNFGGPHAEVESLSAAGDKARGATLFVTLEPCCHQGKTPPCTQALISAGVARVVVACGDPFPPVACGGRVELRAAGIKVELGLLRREAQELNAPYFKLGATGRPFVTAKWAMTLDGKVATRTGDSRWVSSEAARALVQELRARSDAILVGIRTALVDDPLLTCRIPTSRRLTRVILDTHARLPLASRLAQSAAREPLLVVVGSDAPADRVRELQRLGAELLTLPRTAVGLSLEALLEELGRRRMTHLLVEGGPTVLASFFEGRLVDQVVVHVAPKVVGGQAAPGAVGGEGVGRMTEAHGLELRDFRQVDSDIEVRATVAGVYGTYFPSD